VTVKESKMNEKAPVLKGEVRERLGTRYSKRLREAGRLPVVVYGHGKDVASISVDAKETIRYIHDGSRVFTIDVAGEQETVLLRDVQFDYLGDGIIHADLSRVDLDETTHAHVHVALKGDSVGLKEANTLLLHPVTELSIECKLRDLPSEIEVDISDLGVDGIIHAGEIEMPNGVTLLSDKDDILAHIAHTAVAEVSSEEAEVAADAQPAVISEKKEEESE
jgi:large subunit ribosomal protein L25